jgi:hypothetical protein
MGADERGAEAGEHQRLPALPDGRAAGGLVDVLSFLSGQIGFSLQGMTCSHALSVKRVGPPEPCNSTSCQVSFTSASSYGGRACVERAANPQDCAGIDAELFGDNAHTRSPRTCQGLMLTDSLRAFSVAGGGNSPDAAGSLPRASRRDGVVCPINPSRSPGSGRPILGLLKQAGDLQNF